MLIMYDCTFFVSKVKNILDECGIQIFGLLKVLVTIYG